QVNLEGDVDTFFARVVNQNQLPIAATSYAGTCPPTDGVYPIAVNNEYISGNEFRNPGDANGDGRPDNNWQRLTSGAYQGYTQMRLYPTDGNLPGQFGWLRWLDVRGASGANANSNQELVLALAGTGSLSKGFMEVTPWPATNLPRPASYPERPGELNVGDWVYGSSGYNNSADLRNALDEHVKNRTLMVLPIYDISVGQGSNAAFRIVRLGLFVLRGYGQERGNPYLDLIFLGDPNRQGTACSATPPPPEDTSIVRLTGSVELWPEYQIVVVNERRPVQYVVILDVSGSMNANFIGQGIKYGQVTQCTNGPPGSPPAQDCGEPQYAWNPVQERRIYVAKKALELLIRQTNMPGNPGYDPTQPIDSMALVWFTDNVPSTNVVPFKSNPTELIQAVNSAGAYQGDPY
ncbi:MAG: VWA domain-containing protein, partial [Chloroflexi bacterium]